MEIKDSLEFKNFVHAMDPTVQLERFEASGNSAWVFYRRDGFRDLGNAMKIGHFHIENETGFLALIEDVKRRAKDLGLTEIWGPLGFSTYFDYRLKISGFDLTPILTEPTNSEKDVRLFEKAGFKPDKFYHSHEFKVDGALEGWIRAVKAMSGKDLTPDWTLERVTKSEIMDHADGLYRLTHELFHDHFAYEPVGPAVFKNQILARLMPLMCEKTSLALKDARGVWQGYSLNLRDPHDPRRVLLKTLAISAAAPNRSRLFFEIMDQTTQEGKKHYDRAVICLVAEGLPSDRFVRRLKPKTISYALFRLAL